ncbi:glycosyltransferase family 2 protein [Halosimplex aquaticum]|uniref:Glycosyltransferase family 2 protein n=1 Tax=Halosimplex aquaticum TaxID=3026162 RepID=A0ABD5XV60_9EURY|nr:glycosyltransferase family 2 protein [Halosimplex aquaticum]
MKLSIVVPVYNENGNLVDLHAEITETLGRHYEDWEIIFVDDGSTDGSYDQLAELSTRDRHVKVIRLRGNFGQSAALDAGLQAAKYDVIVTMDADGQNDPADIPRLVDRLEEGYDCVSGWRKDRDDPLGKRAASRFAYLLRRFVLRTDMHDYGCTLKAMRAQAAKELTLTGEMHRYIPPLLTWRGYDVDEVEVNHRERRHGDTKYGWERLPKGFMDLVNVWFWQRYSGRPLHVFGGLGIISGVVGTLAGAYSVYLKLAVGQSLSDTALPLFAAFMCLLGLQFFMSGILADIGVKNYFELRDDRGYRIETVLDGGEPVDVPNRETVPNSVRSR